MRVIKDFSADAAPIIGTTVGPALRPEAWRALTNPRSIALLGASGRASSVSFTSRFMQTNRSLGYDGEIFLVNPNRDSIMGLPCYPDLGALPHTADIVAISLPDEKVLPAVHEAIAHGAKALLVHAGGFAERGAAGIAREQELTRVCAEAGVAALGPNCLGIMSLVNRVSVSSMKLTAGVARGNIAAISQSGSVAGILMTIAGRHGLSFIASTGNEAVTTAEDLIGYAIDDPETRTIVAFIEALRRPEALFGLAARAHRAGKPIIAVKAGMTQRGGEVSHGHTGAIAGSGAVYAQAFAQAGIILAEDFDELAQTVELFATIGKPPRRCRVGMLGTSGGELGAITDQCITLGVDLPAFASATLERLQQALLLPADVLPRNPVDAGTGFTFRGTYKERMRGAIQAVMADEQVDIVAIMQGFHRDSEDIAYSLNREIMAAAAAESTAGKPVVVLASRAIGSDDEVMAEVRAAGVPALEGARPSLRALVHLAAYARQLESMTDEPPAWAAAPNALPRSWPNGVVPQATLFPMLATLGLQVTPITAIGSAEEAAAAVARLGGPGVMKIDTPRAEHKSDVGGVALGVTETTAAARYIDLVACLDPPLGHLAGEAVIVAPQIAAGVEFYIGVRRDPAFGVVVACGMGGRLLEILGRTALVVAPFTASDAMDAIERSGAARFLSGFRGGPRADVGQLAELMCRLGEIGEALGPRLDVLEVNPVIVTSDQPGGWIADARLILRLESMGPESTA